MWGLKYVRIIIRRLAKVLNWKPQSIVDCCKNYMYVVNVKCYKYNEYRCIYTRY